MLLKSKLKRMQKDLTGLYPNNPINSVLEEHKRRKYTLDDWSIEDIRKLVFPKDRECFDPTDQKLIDKWNDTNWLSRDFLKLLSVEELRRLHDWMENQKAKRGLNHAQT